MPTRSSPQPVSLADRVARAFSPVACVRGYRYFHRRRIDLVDRTGTAVEADVKGKRTHRVRVAIEGDRLATRCTCVPELLGPASCRHIWATLLELDRLGALDGVRATPRPMALTMPSDVLVAPPAAVCKETSRTKRPAARRRPARRGG